MEHKEFKSFEEFWPFYMSEHSDRTNRRVHFIGTMGVFDFLIAAVVTGNPWLLIGMPLCGYGFAWFGHFIIEKNRPATFQHPLWSLRGDFKMFFKILTGKMKF
jgi:hypothetical protein